MTRKRLLVLLLAVSVLAMLILGCQDDWDGMDRSSWPVTVTAQAWEAQR